MKISCRIIGAFMIAFLMMALLSLTACIKQNYLDRVSCIWGIDFPDSMNLIYNYKDTGSFGDGGYFYVYETDLDSLSMEFTDMGDEEIEKVNSACSTFLDGMDESYLLNAENTYLYNHTSKNDDFDYLYLIYDINLSRFTILEVHK